MPIQIGQKPESDFKDPLGLLSDCHRRIEHFLGVLIKVCKKSSGAPMSPTEIAPLEKALEYFRHAAPKHTEDEEDSLFPRLRASRGGQAALERLAALESDHRTASRDHRIVDTLGLLWIKTGALNEQELREMNDALERLSQTYARHIAIEDQELFPLAARALDTDQLTEVGREMAARRGVNVPGVTANGPELS